MRVPFPDNFPLPRPLTLRERLSNDLKILVIFGIFATLVIGTLAAMTGKLSDVYAAHVRAEQATMEWQVKQGALVTSLEEAVRTSPTRCSDVTSTLEWVHQHELERQRYVMTIFRFAGGSQYQGVEKTLPQPITEIDCGIWKLTISPGSFYGWKLA